MFLKSLLLLLLFCSSLFSKQCSPYFNPERFYEAPDYLKELLIQNNDKVNLRKFVIEKQELYKFTQEDIATEINENFEISEGSGGFWNDWIEDAYEMKMTPEQVLFEFKNSYFSLEVYIYGVIGDATKLQATKVIYKFFNYTHEVKKYINCKKVQYN